MFKLKKSKVSVLDLIGRNKNSSVLRFNFDVHTVCNYM